MKWKTPAHNRAKATIKAAAQAGAGIDYLPDAPRFRFTPVELSDDPYTGRDEGKPSARGGFSYQNRLKLKNWRPQRLDYAPQYNVPMAGDDWRLTKARKAWHHGSPDALRDWLRRQNTHEERMAA